MNHFHERRRIEEEEVRRFDAMMKEMRRKKEKKEGCKETHETANKDERREGRKEGRREDDISGQGSQIASLAIVQAKKRLLTKTQRESDLGFLSCQNLFSVGVLLKRSAWHPRHLATLSLSE